MKLGLGILFVVPFFGLLGCDGSAEHGLFVKYSTAAGDHGSVCAAPGFDEDGVIRLRLDHSKSLPDLHVEATYDPAFEMYSLRVLEVQSYQKDGTSPATSSLIDEGAYDKQFGDSSSQDLIHVESEGVGYDIEVKGLPGDADCP
jgi:hypothetical protein